MNPRERILAVLRHEIPDRVPKMVNFYPTSFTQYPGKSGEEVFDTEIRFVDAAAPVEQKKFLQYLKSLPEDVYVGSPRILRTYQEWGYHPEIENDAPLGDSKTIEDLADSPLPDFMVQMKPKSLYKKVKAIHDKGYAVMASPPHLGGELFETVWRLRGFNRFMLDLIENPPLVDYLVDQLTAMHISSSVVLTRSGIDILALDDDLAQTDHMLISPQMWRRYFKSHVKKIITTCKTINPDLSIFYHSDGNIELIIPDLIEIGVDILNPIQPDAMDPALLKKQWGDQLVFFGTVGTAQQWSWGSPNDIRAEVKNRIDTVGKNGGLILAPAYDLEPQENIPWENIVAYFDAVEEFGEY